MWLQISFRSKIKISELSRFEFSEKISSNNFTVSDTLTITYSKNSRFVLVKFWLPQFATCQKKIKEPNLQKLIESLALLESVSLVEGSIKLFKNDLWVFPNENNLKTDLKYCPPCRWQRKFYTLPFYFTENMSYYHRSLL